MVGIEQDPDDALIVARGEAADHIALRDPLRQHPVPIAQIRKQSQRVEDRHRDGHGPVARPSPSSSQWMTRVTAFRPAKFAGGGQTVRIVSP